MTTTILTPAATVEMPFLQADGLACVVCDTDYRIDRVACVLVGRSGTGSQTFACVGACADQATMSASGEIVKVGA